MKDIFIALRKKWTLLYVGTIGVLVQVFYFNVWVPTVKPELLGKFNIYTLELFVLFLYFLIVVAGISLDRENHSAITEKLKWLSIILVVVWSPFALIAGLDIVFTLVFNQGGQ